LIANPLCAMCAAKGVTRAATIVDHVEPHHGDRTKFWTGARQSLCAQCHNRDKQRIELYGFLPGCDINGNPTDPRHPTYQLRPFSKRK
jgi:hypothetical protein